MRCKGVLPNAFCAVIDQLLCISSLLASMALFKAAKCKAVLPYWLTLFGWGLYIIIICKSCTWLFAAAMCIAVRPCESVKLIYSGCASKYIFNSCASPY